MRRLQERGTLAPLRPAGGSRLALVLGVAAAVVLADQVATSLAVSHVHRATHVIGPFGLAVGYNSGSAFSLFTGDAAVLAVVATVLIGVLGVLAWRVRSRPMAVVVGLLLGGAIGNLSDRLFRGHHGAVVDYITLSHWPTFNVADACITAGLVLFAVLVLLPRGGHVHGEPHDGSEPPGGGSVER